MANFAPSKKIPSDFNNGEKYLDYNAELGQNGDELQAESINSVIEGLLYTQGLAVNAPDVSEANRTGTVEVSIITYIDGTARLKFKNLKGENGVGIDTIISNGTDINGGNIYNIILEDGRTYNFVAPKGSKGDTGATGAQGPKGEKGDKGDKGDAGEPKTVLQETGQSTTAVMSQKAVTDALANKADKTELQGLATEAYVADEINGTIVQTTGADTLRVMSQKAVTDALASKASIADNNTFTGTNTFNSIKISNEARGEVTTIEADRDNSPIIQLPRDSGTLALMSEIPTSLPANGGNADTVGGKHASDFATSAQGARADSAYQKPTDGIPKTDLSASVQSSLGKADTAVQSLKGYATETYVNTKVAEVVGAAPETLDTLNELATALGDDPNFATTVATEIGKKVDKVDGKGLSQNDFTTADKNKLSGIEAGANKYVLPVAGSGTIGGVMVPSDSSISLTGLGAIYVKDNSHNHTIANVTNLQTTLDGKVDKVDGKGLSSNDFTDAEQLKLAGIEKNANKYVLPVAGSGTIGGVMVSTDSAISLDGNGKIGVKDNSHNHTIANVTNLQKTLDSKADKTDLQGLATETYVDSEVTAQINSAIGNINSLLDTINGEVI